MDSRLMRASRPLTAADDVVRDYVHGVDLGMVEGPVARLPARFTRSLLLEAMPR